MANDKHSRREFLEKGSLAVGAAAALPGLAPYLAFTPAAARYPAIVFA